MQKLMAEAQQELESIDKKLETTQTESVKLQRRKYKENAKVLERDLKANVTGDSSELEPSSKKFKS